jgi:hypothetical protein
MNTRTTAYVHKGIQNNTVVHILRMLGRNPICHVEQACRLLSMTHVELYVEAQMGSTSGPRWSLLDALPDFRTWN